MESVLGGSQDVARCYHLNLVGRDLPGTDTGHSFPATRMASDGNHGVFGKRVAHLLHIYCSGQNVLVGCLLATHRPPASTLSMQEIAFIIKPEASDSDEAIKTSHYVALSGLELTM